MHDPFRLMRLFAQIASMGMLTVILFMSVSASPSILIDDHETHKQIVMALFLMGIILVALEDIVRLNKTAMMLIVAGVMWTLHAVSFHPISSEDGHEHFNEALHKALADVAEVVLFLLPAMAIVESIDHYKGFAFVTYFIIKRSRNNAGLLMPLVCVMSFFLSAIVDNLTATIISVKILQCVLPDQQAWRHACGGLVVVAANAGGSWSPVGDVTTTMLWVQGKITTASIVSWLFIPALVAGSTPMLGIWWQAKYCAPSRSKVEAIEAKKSHEVQESHSGIPSSTFEGVEIEVTMKSKLLLCFGFCCILMVPILKILTGLPPYLGMMIAFGIFWLITDATAKSSEDSESSERTANSMQEHGVLHALHAVDLSSLLFFTGVLLAVSCLDSAGALEAFAEILADVSHGNAMLLCSLLGVSSAVVDNVPLVQASINMFEEPKDSPLWQLLALAAGTGGSLLPVGSVAGVTLMGLEGVGFLWYCKNISLWAGLGFALALATYQLERSIVGE